MTVEPIVRPRLQVLGQAHRESIHSQSIGILSRVGIRVDSGSARTVFARAGNAAVGDDHRVRLTEDCIRWALDAAPSVVQVYDRLGRPAFRLGEDGTRFGIGVTTLYYQDPATDQVTFLGRRRLRRGIWPAV